MTGAINMTVLHINSNVYDSAIQILALWQYFLDRIRGTTISRTGAHPRRRLMPRDLVDTTVHHSDRAFYRLNLICQSN